MAAELPVTEQYIEPPASRRSFYSTFIIAGIVLSVFIANMVINGNPLVKAASPISAQVHKPTEAQAVQATQAQSQPTPTLIRPTETALPTSTAQPTATARPTTIPSPTQDVEYIKAVNEAQAQAREIKLQQDAREMEIAWGWVKLAGVSILMAIAALLVVFGAVTAYWRTWFAKQTKPAQQAVHAPTVAQDEEIEPTPDDDMPCDPETLAKWCAMIDWTTGKMPAEAAVDDMFGGQEKYRQDFLPWLTRWKFAGKSKRDQWYVTIHFSNWVGIKFIPSGREIESPKNVHSV